MVDRATIQRWSHELTKARGEVVRIEMEMLMSGWIRTGQQSQVKLGRIENNLAVVAWLCENTVKQPGLWENEPESIDDSGSGGGSPWD